MGRHAVPRVGGSDRRGGRIALAAGLAGLSVAGFAAVGYASEPAPPPPAPALVEGTPCTAAARACVDLTEGEAWLIENGAVTYGPVLVSSGALGEETPTGSFRVEWKHLHHISGESGVPMPYSVFFAPGGIAFHEGSIYSESAGCVRMEREHAKVFYDSLQVGDVVEVTEPPA